MSEEDKIRQRIEALLSKTVDKGATEEEEMAAMAKAMELIAKYQIDMTKEKAQKQGAVIDKIIFDLPLARFVAFALMNAIEVAADVKCFRRGEGNFYAVGLEEDVRLAKWLYINLTFFSIKSVNEWWRHPDNYIPSEDTTGAKRKRIKESFLIGFANRCYQRAREEKRKIEEKIASSSNALVVVKTDIINQFMSSNGIAPKSKKDKKSYIDSARIAGYKKGAEAQLGKMEKLNESTRA